MHQESSTQRSSPFLRALLVVLSIAALGAALIFWIYGKDAHYDRAASVWPGTERELTPPAATDITLQRDFLDHFAIYTVPQEDLEAFFRSRFERTEEGTLASAVSVGKPMGRLGWIVPEGCLVYSHYTPNGAASTYYHDPATGSTYQSSAHW